MTSSTWEQHAVYLPLSVEDYYLAAESRMKHGLNSLRYPLSVHAFPTVLRTTFNFVCPSARSDLSWRLTKICETTMMRTPLIFSVLFRLCSMGSAEYCNGIQPGDIMVTGFNMDEPDQVLLVLLESVAEGGAFYMTDRPWDGTAFLDADNDGTLKVSV